MRNQTGDHSKPGEETPTGNYAYHTNEEEYIFLDCHHTLCYNDEKIAE